MHGHGMDDEFRKKFENPNRFLPSILNKGEIIAELGCGIGFYCEYLIKYAKILYCVDSFCPALEIAKKKVPSAIFLCESADKTSIPSETVDSVILANSFHDMNNKEGVVKEIYRMLKPNGKVIIIDWDKDEKTPFGPPVWLRMSKEEYMKYFKSFKLLKEFKPSNYQFGLILVKS